MMKYNLPNDFKEVEIVSSEVSDGSMTTDTKDGLKRARKLLKKIGTTSPLCYMEQVHGNKILIAERDGFYRNADGLVTKRNFVLSVKTADCVPVMIYDPKAQIFGAVHAGREGIIKRILSLNLKRILKELSSNPRDLMVFIGPHIRLENYPIGLDAIRDLDISIWGKFIKNVDGKSCFDLTSAAISELEGIGVMDQNIIDCKIDTFADARFFSCRRDREKEGERFLTAIYKK